VSTITRHRGSIIYFSSTLIFILFGTKIGYYFDFKPHNDEVNNKNSTTKNYEEKKTNPSPNLNHSPIEPI